MMSTSLIIEYELEYGPYHMDRSVYDTADGCGLRKIKEWMCLFEHQVRSF